MTELRRYRRHLARELDNVSLYRGLADSAEGEYREVLLALAAAEERHAEYWEARLNELGVVSPPASEHRRGLRTRFVSWLGRRLGVRMVVPLLERVEASERTRYDTEAAATEAMAADERVHAHLVSSLAPTWRARAATSIRAAVFGVNDGIVSNLSLVMGMAGGAVANNVVVLAGVAGLVAGAGSMAAGEFISVKSQREIVEAGAGLGPIELAALSIGDPDTFELLARAAAQHDSGQADGETVLGGVGSPMSAAGFSFVAFAVGAAVPLLPFIFTSGTTALIIAAGLAAGALFVVGALISLVTDRSAIRSGLRQLGVGALAAAGTYLVGRGVGVGLS
ncbi:MAG: VIT1/CCC1 family protein [Actinomycetota bacterium]|nr:VIT1/CCC1 family protein [Actinomycetota bacterium]